MIILRNKYFSLPPSDLIERLFSGAALNRLKRQAGKQIKQKFTLANKPKPEIFKQIGNIEQYVKDKGLSIGKARKIKPIEGAVAKGGEQITTIASDGLKETTNVAKAGDFIAHNSGNVKNQYIIPEEVFKRDYIPHNGKFIKNTEVNVAKIPENVEFMAPWGEKMKVRRGGQFVVNPGDSYGISKKDFRKTYRRIRGSKKK